MASHSYLDSQLQLPWGALVWTFTSFSMENIPKAPQRWVLPQFLPLLWQLLPPLLPLPYLPLQSPSQHPHPVLEQGGAGEGGGGTYVVFPGQGISGLKVNRVFVLKEFGGDRPQGLGVGRRIQPWLAPGRAISGGGGNAGVAAAGRSSPRC